MLKKKALVTGASKGIGRAIAERLLTEGYEVLGTSRNPETMKKEDKIDGVSYFALDQTSSKSIQKLVEEVGDVDLLINNAGGSQLGPIEHVPMDKVESYFRLNVFGPIEIIQGFLPMMRDKKSGVIINVTSMSARTPVPFSSFYASTKAAMETFTRGLRNEVAAFGIKVAIISPFGIKTKIPQDLCLPEDSPYECSAKRAKAIRDKTLAEKSPGPEVVSDCVMKILKKKNPRPSYSVGHNAWLTEHLARIMPSKMVENSIRKRYGI